MAKDKSDTPIEEEPNTNDEQPTEETGSSQAVKWIVDYTKEPLENDISNAASNEKVACLGYWEQKKVNDVKICRLQNGRKVYNEYLGIKNCVSSVLEKHTERLETNVNGFVEKNTEMQTSLQTALENLKEVKSHLTKVSELACKLDINSKDGCHSDQRKAMSKLPTANGVSGLARFDAEVATIIATAKNLNSNGNSIFEAGVKFAGIRSFINLSSLQSQMAKLKEDATTLNADVDANMEELATKNSECQEKYLEGITEITARLFDSYQSQAEHDALTSLDGGLGSLETFECTDGKFETLREELERLCESTTSNFPDTIKCPSPETSKFEKIKNT